MECITLQRILKKLKNPWFVCIWRGFQRYNLINLFVPWHYVSVRSRLNLQNFVITLLKYYLLKGGIWIQRKRFFVCSVGTATPKIPLIEFNFIYYINFKYVCWCVEKDLNNLHNQGKISLRRCWCKEQRVWRHCLMMMGSGSWYYYYY